MVNCFHRELNHSDSLSLICPSFFPCFHLVDFFSNDISSSIVSLRPVYLNFVCALLTALVLSYTSFATFLDCLSLSSLASLPVIPADVEQHQWSQLDIPDTYGQKPWA